MSDSLEFSYVLEVSHDDSPCVSEKRRKQHARNNTYTEKFNIDLGPLRLPTDTIFAFRPVPEEARVSHRTETPII